MQSFFTVPSPNGLMSAPLLMMALLPLLLFGQELTPSAAQSDSPPAPITKVPPVYPKEAIAAGVQGTVLLQVAIDEKGVPSEILVVSPLGFGLDDSAIKAVKQWRFQPATRDGEPVIGVSYVEINFRLEGANFDRNLERRRTIYNQVLAAADNKAVMQPERALELLQKLVKENYAPAMHLMARLYRDGQWVVQNPEKALSLVQQAAGKDYGPAVYQVGRMLMAGDQLRQDPDTGLKMVHKAAHLGSVQAQLYLAIAYEAGKPVPRDPERARHFFRLCAAAGQELCQCRLAQSLLQSPRRSENDLLQALAWYSVAAEMGSVQAKEALNRELPKLSAAQRASVDRLKRKLARKP